MNLTFKGKLLENPKHRKTGSLLDGNAKSFNAKLAQLETVQSERNNPEKTPYGQSDALEQVYEGVNR